MSGLIFGFFQINDPLGADLSVSNLVISYTCGAAALIELDMTFSYLHYERHVERHVLRPLSSYARRRTGILLNPSKAARKPHKLAVPIETFCFTIYGSKNLGTRYKMSDRQHRGDSMAASANPKFFF